MLKKDNIYGVSIFLDSRFDNWEMYGGPDLNTIDLSLFTHDVYYSWTGADGHCYIDYDLSTLTHSPDELPIIGFDDISLQVTTVPVPAAFWLFGSGILAGLGFMRKYRKSA